jgi:retinol dehydrogenase 12
LELVKILYQHNAIVYLAGRSVEKGLKAVDAIKTEFPDSKGRVEFLKLELDKLSTIQLTVDDFLSREKLLHVLINNAGVMLPPMGSKTQDVRWQSTESRNYDRNEALMILLWSRATSFS